MTQTAHASKQENRIRALFEPESIAVVGASRRPDAVGYAILENLLKGHFKGRLFPVNPKADEILGVPCSPSIDAIPEPFDLAVLIVPAHSVPDALQACAEKGVKAVIIISAGFREVGPEGAELEKQVQTIAAKYEIPVLGPNCLGLINTDYKYSVNASFSRTMPAQGNIAFISQSGALCTAVLDYAKGAGIGFSKFVSLGNKISLNEIDMLRYLKDDDQTHVVLMYVEDIVHGRRFIETAREITGDMHRTKPILVIKSGRTAQGAKAAQSHTGSLMGSDEVYDALFAQAGVLRMESVEEMFDLGIAFSRQPVPKGHRVAIVTNAGGPGIMATDSCVRKGLTLAEFQPETVDALSKVLPPTANLHNPIDVIGDARHDRYEEAMRIAGRDPNVDAMLVILTPQAMTDIEGTAKVIVRVEKELKIPLIACFMGIVDVSSGVRILEENNIPHYRFPEGAAHALAAMYRYEQWKKRPRTVVKHFNVDEQKAEEILHASTEIKRSLLPAHHSMQLLQAYGFPVPPFTFGETPEKAAEASGKLQFPVAVKAVSAQIVHKFDVGAVALKLEDAGAVRQACDIMLKTIAEKAPEAVVDGFMVQSMAPNGKEVILGMNKDPQLGPALMFGLGGVYVEALRDVTFRLAPIRERGAQKMISSIKAYKILKGTRGEGPVDFKAIEDCLERLSQLACEHPYIREIDINPLIVHPEGQGASVVDARIILDV